MKEYIMERKDYDRVQKLERLHNIDTFWDDVRKLTRNVRSDHSIGRWQILAEVRYGELKQAKRAWEED